MRYSTVGCLVILTLNLLMAPLTTQAQLREKIQRVAVLDPTSPERPSPCLLAFQQGLRDLGYVEGQSLLLDYRYAEGHVDRLPALAAELVQRTPDVLWTNSAPAAWAAKRATTTIPIVVGVSDGLVEQGLVASVARPGGNLTREAQALGLQLQRVEAGTPAAFDMAFAAMVQGGADALLIMGSPLVAAHRQQLLALALQHRLPTMAYGRHLAEAGSLLAYGADSRALCQRSAVFVHKILHGVKPADLPIEQATFQLVVNLKTAEALGVTFPPTFLFQADELIK